MWVGLSTWPLGFGLGAFCQLLLGQLPRLRLVSSATVLASCSSCWLFAPLVRLVPAHTSLPLPSSARLWDCWFGGMLLRHSFSLVLWPWWSVSGYASRKGTSMSTCTKSCIILIVTRTMSIISISIALEKHHANLTVTYTNMLVSSIVTVILLIFTIDTSTSEKRREIHSLSQAQFEMRDSLQHGTKSRDALLQVVRTAAAVLICFGIRSAQRRCHSMTLLLSDNR